MAVAGMLADKDVAGDGAGTRRTGSIAGCWPASRTSLAACRAEALQARLPPLRGQIELLRASMAEACERARALAQPRDRIVVFGSFHVVGPALVWLGLY